MKTNRRAMMTALGAVALSLGTLGASDLEIGTYAGLTITGDVGKIYSVEYVTDLEQEEDWKCLEFVQLLENPFLWTDKSGPANQQRFYRAVAMEAPSNMVFIPPGTFRMGSPEDEVDHYDREGPQTEVTISRGYWMGKYEVTQGEYLSVTRSNPCLPERACHSARGGSVTSPTSTPGTRLRLWGNPLRSWRIRPSGTPGTGACAEGGVGRGGGGDEANLGEVDDPSIFGLTLWA